MTTLKKLEELIYKGFKETDERLAQHRKEIDDRMERSFQATKHEVDRLAKQFDGVTNSLSRFSEQTVYPAFKRLFGERGVRLNLFYSNLEAQDLNGDKMETDIVGLGPKCAVLIEVKLRLRQSDVEEFLEERLPRFFHFFPSFKRPVLYGGVAGMSIDKGADRFAYRRGLFVIGQTGENVRILNDKKFRPRSFAATQDDRFPKRKTKRQRA